MAEPTCASRRCSGHCCKRFVLPLDPEGLRLQAEAMRAYREDRPQPEGVRLPLYQDVEQIADMAIFLEESDVDSNGDKQNVLSFFYTCRHLQPNGDCGDYANRPRMCSNYPYGRACNYRGCTYQPAPEPDDCKRAVLQVGG